MIGEFALVAAMSTFPALCPIPRHLATAPSSALAMRLDNNLSLSQWAVPFLSLSTERGWVRISPPTTVRAPAPTQACPCECARLGPPLTAGWPALTDRPEGTPSIFSRPAPEYRKPGDEYSGHPEGQEDSLLLDQTYDESTSQDYT